MCRLCLFDLLDMMVVLCMQYTVRIKHLYLIIHPCWLVADQTGDVNLNDGDQDPVEDEHEVLAGQSCLLSEYYYR